MDRTGKYLRAGHGTSDLPVRRRGSGKEKGEQDKIRDEHPKGLRRSA
jgi:hypothetical protein